MTALAGFVGMIFKVILEALLGIAATDKPRTDNVVKQPSPDAVKPDAGTVFGNLGVRRGADDRPTD